MLAGLVSELVSRQKSAGLPLLRDALLSGSTYPPGGALGIICASVSPLWEASFSLQLTPWGSISPIPAPMGAVAQTGRPVAEATLPSLPPFTPQGASEESLSFQGLQETTWHFTTAAQTTHSRGHEAGLWSQRGPDP